MQEMSLFGKLARKMGAHRSSGFLYRVGYLPCTALTVAMTLEE